MAIAFDTTETSGWRRTTVTDTSSNGTIVVDKPTGAVENDWLVAVIHNNAALNPGTIGHPSGFTEIVTNTNLNGNFRMHTTYAIKKLGASEPSSYTWTIGASVADDSVTLFRVTGLDEATQVDAIGVENSASATSFTGLSITTATDGAVILWTVGARDGNVLTATDSGYPAGTTGIFSRATRASSNGVNSGFALQTVATAGASGAAVWNSYLSSAKYGTALGVAFRPSVASGPSFTALTDPIDDSISGTVSEPVTATHYRVSAGGTSANIEIPGGPITGTSFAVTGIDRENLPFIANTADTGAPATVSLTNGETVLVSTTADLVTAAGTTAHIVTNPDLSSAHSIFNPLYCDTTPEDGQDQFWYTGDPGVSIAANGAVTGEGGFTLQAWDKSALLRGAIASYTISGGVIYPRSPVGRSPVGVSPIGKSPKGIAA